MISRYFQSLSRRSASDIVSKRRDQRKARTSGSDLVSFDNDSPEIRAQRVARSVDTYGFDGRLDYARGIYGNE